MGVVESVKESLLLLSRRDRRRFLVVTGIQMSTAFLDLLGVLLIGFLTAYAVGAMGGGTPSPIVLSIQSALGLGSNFDMSFALTLAALAGVFLLSKSAISAVLTRKSLKFLANRQAVVAGQLISSLVAQPLAQLQQRSSQQLAYALTTGVNDATLIILGQSMIVLTEATMLIVLGLGLLVVSPWITIFAVGFFIAIGLGLQRLLSGWAGGIGHKSRSVQVASFTLIQEVLQSYREVTVSNRRNFYSARYKDLRWEAARVQSDLQFIGLVPKYVFEVALVVGAAALAVSQFLTKDATSAISVIVLFLVAGSRVVPSLLRLQNAFLTVRTTTGVVEPTYQLAHALGIGGSTAESQSQEEDLAPAAVRSRVQKSHEGFRADLEIRNVSVAYPDAQQDAITDVSLSAAAGSSLAIVGPTGAGKSTLADVILGVLAPTAGTVTIGGLPPLDCIERWPGGLAYVPQEVAMTNGTVRDNVALGLPRTAVVDDWVWEALERANLADFVSEERDGLDTIVGEHGVRFSGGQRQRLGIARALYTKPRLLVLDEATSALDAETERTISETIKDLEGKTTTIMIAHRLATVRDCDKVAYLDSGRVLSVDSFAGVRRRVPAFDEQARLLGL